ncbi:MAG TPA: C40 family peptidase [Blastococcus sp.]
MATPVLTRALNQFPADPPSGPTRIRRIGLLRSGLLIGATTALTLTALPGTAGAAPGDASTPEQAMQFVTDASHKLEVVSEQLNEARVVLERQQAAAAAADQAAADAQARLDALDGQIRQLARTAYTGDTMSQLDLMLTSDSAEEFVSQLGTLDAIAGHTNDLVSEIAVASEAAASAQQAADRAEADAQKTVDDIAAQQHDLEAEIAKYQSQYDALTAPQREQVDTAHAGAALAVPTGVLAPSGAAQAAVDAALAQVGDPYVWGASGPNAFDCSGLTQYAYSVAGASLPHSSSSQARMGTPVSRSELQPGDLVFFYSPVSHVGMYIGNGQMVHASTAGKPVQVVSLDSLGSYNSARRIAG